MSPEPVPPDCDERFTTPVLSEPNARFVLKRPAGKTLSVEESARKPQKSLRDIIGVSSGGPGGRRAAEPNHTVERYEEFLDLIRLVNSILLFMF